MNSIQVGIIGCGKISDLHALGYRNNDQARIAAVSDIDLDLANRKGAQWGADRSYRDYRSLLEDPKIDAVEILTPQKLHEQMTLEALEAGKHVLLQKPMTISLESADRMIKASESSGKVFKVIENYIYYPPIITCRELIDAGVIGDPIQIRIKFLSGSSGGWDIPEETWAWRFEENAEGRGMQTFDHGHHMWSAAWYLMGNLERVNAWIDSYNGVIDCPASIMWKYEGSGRYGICDYTHAYDMHIPSKYYANDEWIEVYGSKGIILINRCTGNVKEGAVLSIFDGEQWEYLHDIPSDWSEGFIGSTKNFIRAIQGHEQPMLSGKDARRILSYSLAIQRSSRERREVYIKELDSPLGEQYSKERIAQEINEQKHRRNVTLEELKNGPRML